MMNFQNDLKAVAFVPCENYSILFHSSKALSNEFPICIVWSSYFFTLTQNCSLNIQRNAESAFFANIEWTNSLNW